MHQVIQKLINEGWQQDELMEFVLHKGEQMAVVTDFGRVQFI